MNLVEENGQPAPALSVESLQRLLRVAKRTAHQVHEDGDFHSQSTMVNVDELLQCVSIIEKEVGHV
jgi:hypothetical protein